MFQQVQAQLEEAQVTTVCTMNDRDPVVMLGLDTQKYDPDISQTSSYQQTRHALVYCSVWDNLIFRLSCQQCGDVRCVLKSQNSTRRLTPTLHTLSRGRMVSEAPFSVSLYAQECPADRDGKQYSIY